MRSVEPRRPSISRNARPCREGATRNAAGTRRCNAKFAGRPSPRPATPISTSCRTGASNRGSRTRRRKNRSTSRTVHRLSRQQRRSYIAASLAAKQEQQAPVRTGSNPCGLKGIPAGGCERLSSKGYGGRSQRRARKRNAPSSPPSPASGRCFRENYELEESAVWFFQAKAKRSGSSSRGEVSGPVQSAAAEQAPPRN